MLAALALVLPLGLGGAISPVMLTEQTVLLAGAGGIRAGTFYAVGVLGTLLVIVGAIVLFGQAISLPTEPRLDASLDLVVGGVLLAIAAVVTALGRRRPSRSTHRRRHSLTGEAALPFGVFSMATNFTTLALVVPAAKEISSTEGALPGRLVLIVLLVALAGIPAWAPVVLTRAAPDSGHRVLTAVGDWTERHGRQASVVLLSVAALFFLARGTTRLLDSRQPAAAERGPGLRARMMADPACVWTRCVSVISRSTKPASASACSN